MHKCVFPFQTWPVLQRICTRNILLNKWTLKKKSKIQIIVLHLIQVLNMFCLFLHFRATVMRFDHLSLMTRAADVSLWKRGSFSHEAIIDFFFLSYWMTMIEHTPALVMAVKKKKKWTTTSMNHEEEDGADRNRRRSSSGGSRRRRRSSTFFISEKRPRQILIWIFFACVDFVQESVLINCVSPVSGS